MLSVAFLALLSFFALVDSQCIVNEATTRLPSFIVPTNYYLNYTLPSPSTPTIVTSNSASFSGNVSITLQIQQTTTCIAIHSYLLALSSITLLTDFGTQLSPASTQYLDAAQISVLNFAQPITPQIAQLTIAFSGNFNNQSAMGFFLSDNVFDPSSLSLENKLEAFRKRNTPKKERHQKMLELTAGNPKMYATQFEASAARFAYPSFDEPEFKAIFTLSATVTYDSSANNRSFVLFNTPLSSTTYGVGQTTFTFEPTPHPMSTYLVAIAVGEFEFLEATNGNGGTFRIYTPPGASQYAAFALNVTKNVVAYFSKIWDFDYFSMMRKMDQISVPAIDEDAMENWGLLTYYPGFLLVDAANPKTPLPSLQIVSLVVVHEIAHQWFGDTVTTPWWNQIFLNEGYARFLQYIGTDYLFPEWEIFTQGGDNSYFNFAYLPALQADFMGLVHPIVNFSQTSGLPSILSADFGIIPYGKGASINRMMASYLTNPVWNQVMAYHLQKHQYTNPSILDLLQSYDDVLETPISEKLFPYFIYSGFPVLTVEVLGTTLELTQSPISRYGNFNPKPFWVHTHLQCTDLATGITYDLVADFDTTNTTIALPHAGSWAILADLNFTSYQLVNYDLNTWNQIISQITKMADVNRQLIVQSQFMLLQMGFLNPKIVSNTTLALSANFESVDDLYPLYQTIFDNWVSFLGLFQYNNSVYESILDDLIPSIAKIAGHVGIYNKPNEDADTRALRSLAMFYSAYFSGASNVTFDELAMYESGFPIEQEQKKGVYWAVVRYNPTGYNSILQLYKNSSTSESDKALLIFALLGPNNTTQCQTTLSLISGSTNFSTAQQLHLVSQMMRYNLECRTVAWNSYVVLAQSAWQKSGTSVTPTIIAGFDGLFSTVEDLTAVKTFIAKNEQYLTEEQITEIFVRIQINMEVVAKWG